MTDQMERLTGLLDELQECDPETKGDTEMRARIAEFVSQLISEARAEGAREIREVIDKAREAFNV